MMNLIVDAVRRGASDLHIKTGDVIRARINGVLQPLSQDRLTPQQVQAVAAKMIADPEVRERMRSLKEYDCSYGIPKVGRFRVSIFSTTGVLCNSHESNRVRYPINRLITFTPCR